MSSKPFKKGIFLTRPILPPLSKLTGMFAKSWQSKQLTNHGPHVQKLEIRLQKILGVPRCTLFNNGTTALMTAAKVLNLKGEVIITPFTFPATVHALTWIGLKPVFCDIDPISMNIDAGKIESLISPRTSAILPVHTFGAPCDVMAIEAVASRHKLKVIYDAAHAFGVEVCGRGIGTFGDITMFSFHATKLFHTAEGGCLTCNGKELNEYIKLLKNFGIQDEEKVVLPGINGKMSEIHAAIGLAVLPRIKDEIKKRKALTKQYRHNLGAIPGIYLTPKIPGVKSNFQYFVIRIDKKVFRMSRDAVYEKLRSYNVFARKYFFPLCSNFPHYKHLPSSRVLRLPVANRVAEEVLCLPLYGGLFSKDVQKICRLIQAMR